MLSTHVDIIHHFSKNHSFAAIILHDDVQNDFVTKIVTSFVDEHIPRAVVLIHLRCLCLNLNLEELVRPDIVLDLHIIHIKLLVACNQHKFGTFWNLHISSVLESPHILNIIIFLEHHVLFERHVVEFGLILRI